MSKSKGKRPGMTSQPNIKPQAVADITQTAGGLVSWATNMQLHTIAIAVLAVAVYINTLGLGFAQDDAIVLTDNMFTAKGIGGIRGILSYDTFYGFFKEAGKDALVQGGRYRPLTVITFAIEYQIFGKPNAFFSHLVNVLLFALTCTVLYKLLVRILTPRFGILYACGVALVTSLLFAAHPIHTEAVTNIKGRDEILTLLLCFWSVQLAIDAYLLKNTGKAIMGAVVFFLALMSKENAITFLAILPMVFYFFFHQESGSNDTLDSQSGKKRLFSFGTLIPMMLPFVAATVAFIVVRTAVIGFQFTKAPIELMNNPFVKLVNGQWVPFSGSEKLATITFTLGKYIQLLLLPHPLSHDYYPRAVDIMTWANPKVLLSFALYAGMIFYVFKNWKTRSVPVFAVAFYLITLSIVSNLVFPVGTNLAERFMFMPSVGFCLLVAHLLVTRLSSASLPKFETGMRTALMGVAVVVALYSIKTFTRNFDWEDNYTLFNKDIETVPTSAKLLNGCGSILSDSSTTQKDTIVRRQMLEKSIKLLKDCVQIHPTYDNAYMYLGNDYMYLNMPDTALTYYRKALQYNNSNKSARTNLGNCLRTIGKQWGEQRGNVDMAMKYLTEAYQINPTDIETIRLLGVAHAVKGETQKGVEYMELFLQQVPADTINMKNLIAAYSQMGNAAKVNEIQQRILKVRSGGK